MFSLSVVSCDGVGTQERLVTSLDLGGFRRVGVVENEFVKSAPFFFGEHELRVVPTQQLKSSPP
jgi:hypothetical protein